MNNCNRNPGASRGLSPIPTRQTFPGRSYYEWKHSGQLWPRSPSGAWRVPAPGLQGMGPAVGMIRQILQWNDYQNYGFREQSRVLVPIPQQRGHWRHQRGIRNTLRGRGRGSWTNTTNSNVFVKQNEERQVPEQSSSTRAARGRGLWPNYSRAQAIQGSVRSQSASSRPATTVTSTVTSKAASEGGQTDSLKPISGNKPSKCSTSKTDQTAEGNVSGEKNEIHVSGAAQSSSTKVGDNKERKSTSGDQKEVLRKSDDNSNVHTKKGAIVPSVDVAVDKKNLDGNGNESQRKESTKASTEADEESQKLKTSENNDTQIIIKGADGSISPDYHTKNDKISSSEKHEVMNHDTQVCEQVYHDGGDITTQAFKRDKANKLANSNTQEQVEICLNPVNTAALASSGIESSERITNSTVVGPSRSPVGMEKRFKKNKSWTAGQLSPHAKELIARSPINKSRLQTDLVKAWNISSSQQTEEPKMRQERSSKESNLRESPEVLMLPDGGDTVDNDDNIKTKEIEDNTVKLKEETSLKVTSSDAQMTDTKSSVRVEASLEKSCFPNKKSMSSPILNRLGEVSSSSTTAATEATSSGTNELNSSLKNWKISEGIKNLRKMLKSASFATSGALTNGKNPASVKSTNNGVKMEKEDGLGTDVKPEARCEDSMQDVTDVKEEDEKKVTAELSVTKHESSSESAIKTESTLLDHSKDDNIVKLDGSGAGVMDTEDISLSLSQSSNFGRSDMFKNDSLLLGDESSQGALLEDYSDDDDDLPEDDHIGIAMAKIFPKGESSKKSTSESEDDPNSRQISSRSPLSQLRSERRVEFNKVHQVSKESSAEREKKLTLDSLLDDHKKTADDLQKINDMEVKLKEGIAAGGINRFIDAEAEDEEDLLPEHKDQLKNYSIKDGVIPEEHPGEPVFDNSKFGQVYSLPDHCRLKEDFNFTPGSSRIDQMLANASPDIMAEILQSDIILTCITRISNPHAVLNWLFHLMSIHTSSLTSKCIQDLLYHVLHIKQGPPLVKSWAPSFREIFKLFLNYGANCDSLFVILEVADEVNEIVPNVPNQVHNNNVANNERHQEPSSFRLENLKFVLRVLTWALQQRPDLYPEHTLNLYTLLTCRVALAEQLTQGYHTYEFEALISAQLDVLAENEWSTMETWLCSYLPNITDHHHNKVYLTEIMPHTDRGLHLKRRLSFCMLQQLIKSGETARSPENFVVQHLHPIVQKLRIVADTDYYELWSIISLIDTCVGNETLCQTDRGDLKLLMEKLGKLKSSIKEVINQLDRTIVKDKIVWLDSKWKFRVQNRSQNQQSMFAYTSNRMVEEVNVVSIQDDDELEEDEIEPDSVDIKQEEEEDSGNETDSENLGIKLDVKEEIKEEIQEEEMDTS